MYVCVRNVCVRTCMYACIYMYLSVCACVYDMQGRIYIWATTQGPQD